MMGLPGRDKNWKHLYRFDGKGRGGGEGQCARQTDTGRRTTNIVPRNVYIVARQKLWREYSAERYSKTSGCCCR